MDRCKLYNIVTADAGDGVVNQELDFLNNNMAPFEFNNDPLYYRVMQADAGIPDLISFKVYQQERLWWFLNLANNVVNAATDIVPGDLWTIPALLDVYDYYRKYRVR